MQIQESRGGVSQRSSCVGTSEGVTGNHHGSIYEHVPLTALRLNPISRVNHERVDIRNPHDIRLSACPPNHSPSHRGELADERFHASAPWLNSDSCGPLSSSKQGMHPIAADAAGPQDSLRHQAFVYSHMISAPMPEECSISLTQECPSASSSLVEESCSLSAIRGGRGKGRKAGASNGQGKLQICFSDEPRFTSDPPAGPSTTSAILAVEESTEGPPRLEAEKARAEASARRASAESVQTSYRAGTLPRADPKTPHEGNASLAAGKLRRIVPYYRPTICYASNCRC